MEKCLIVSFDDFARKLSQFFSLVSTDTFFSGTVRISVVALHLVDKFIWQK